MTDTEYIEAFRQSDQRGIREAYHALKRPFVGFLRLHCTLPEDYLEDAYQEAFVRLQQNILYGRLTEETLSGTLLGYLEGIGYNAAMELARARKEQPLDNPVQDEDDGREWTDELSAEETEDPTEMMQQQEREQVIRALVMEMQKPCAPLLLGFYWDEKPMDQLAQELGYSGADSAKAQKAKCMKHLRNYAQAKLRKYGYENG